MVEVGKVVVSGLNIEMRGWRRVVSSVGRCFVRLNVDWGEMRNRQTQDRRRDRGNVFLYRRLDARFVGKSDSCQCLRGRREKEIVFC
jgi:hypothetical protein